MKRFFTSLVLATMALSVLSPTATANESDLILYEVTIENLSKQPLSPAVAATHDRGMRLWNTGEAASAELVEIAENGNQIPQLEKLLGSELVTEAVNVGVPLTPAGTVVGDFTDSVTFFIHGYPGDRLSLATMLICTNDGFTGVTNLDLPDPGDERQRRLLAYDAGSEQNTEMSEDLVDPCSGLGLTELDGDPNGNENEAVNEADVVRRHPRGTGGGDLSGEFHGFFRRIGTVKIAAVGNDA